MLRAFEPVIDKNCRIIILGTMPGVKSLEKQEYYGHERNTFWRIITALFNKGTIIEYSAKKALLLNNHIALWDVLKACEREGSLDSNIKNPVPNDFETLFEKYPNIKTIYFNGEPAEKLFHKLVSKKTSKIPDIRYRLPSTSPANAIGFEQKHYHWSSILLSLKDLSASKIKNLTTFVSGKIGVAYEVCINFSTMTAKHRTFDNDNHVKTEKTVTLIEEELIIFYHRLWEKGILSWKQRYENENQLAGGIHWYVKLELCDRVSEYTGDNVFPKTWSSFCDSIQRLIKEPFG